MKPGTQTNLEGRAMGQMSFFDYSDAMQKISDCGDPLEKLNAVMEWKLFEGLISKVRVKENLARAGRPAFDGMMMFKVLLLQTLYNISDAQAEFQIRDRLVSPKARPRNEEHLRNKIKELVKGQFLKGVIDWNLFPSERGWVLDFSINQKRLDQVEDDLGFRILMTDRHAWSSSEIIKAYQGQSKVEYALKT
jgi:hypothetical protein